MSSKLRGISRTFLRELHAGEAEARNQPKCLAVLLATAMFLPMDSRRAILVGMVALAACDLPPDGPALTLTSHPRVTDRYARLLAQQRSDTTLALQQELTCEAGRLYRALGDAESWLRLRAAEDTILREEADRAAREQTLERFHMKSLQGGGPVCDSLNAIAGREDPIGPVDSQIRNRPWRR